MGLRCANRWAGLQIESGVTMMWLRLRAFNVVIPAGDCRDAGGRAKRDARAEAGGVAHGQIFAPAISAFTTSL